MQVLKNNPLTFYQIEMFLFHILLLRYQSLIFGYYDISLLSYSFSNNITGNTKVTTQLLY